MIFCNYNYKEFNNNNKNEWPLQPPTQENWNKMVNENYNYCLELKSIDFPNHLNSSDLPSFHPYWTEFTKQNTIKTLERHIKNYEICKKDPNQIKYLYNLDTTLKMISDKIEKLKSEIN